jgi:hypothetical protein
MERIIRAVNFWDGIFGAYRFIYFGGTPVASFFRRRETQRNANFWDGIASGGHFVTPCHDE